MVRDTVLFDNGRQSLVYMDKSIGRELEHEDHLNAQEQKLNNDCIKRRTVYGQSDMMKIIECQYQLIQSQHRNRVH